MPEYMLVCNNCGLPNKPEARACRLCSQEEFTTQLSGLGRVHEWSRTIEIAEFTFKLTVTSTDDPSHSPCPQSYDSGLWTWKVEQYSGDGLKTLSGPNSFWTCVARDLGTRLSGTPATWGEWIEDGFQEAEMWLAENIEVVWL